MRKWGAQIVVSVALVVGCRDVSIPANPHPLRTISDAQAVPSHRDDSGVALRRRSLGAGFPENGPWLSFYGTAAEMGDLGRVASRFRIINIDADPGAAAGAGNFTDEQIRELRSGGKNRVLSYFNVGSCEEFRSYWHDVPVPLVSCEANRAAQLGVYDGYADERWMNPGEPEYRKLLLDYVAPRLVARGIDGFYLDNLEVVEHEGDAREGICDAACRQGGLDFVRALRERFPDRLIVMQNATSEVTRLGTSGGVPFPALLDGIAHEEVYAPTYDELAERQLLAWSAMGVTSQTGRPFFIGVEDYVGSCANAPQAQAAYGRARERGFSPYASDESAGQRVVCFWGF